MKTKVIILMLSLLLSCTTDKEKQLEKSIEARQDTVDQVQRQRDSLLKSIVKSSEDYADTLNRYDPSEYEQTCRN